MFSEKSSSKMQLHRVMPRTPPLPPLPRQRDHPPLLSLPLLLRPRAMTFMATGVRSGDSKLSRHTAHELTWRVCLSVLCGTQVSEARAVWHSPGVHREVSSTA